MSLKKNMFILVVFLLLIIMPIEIQAVNDNLRIVKCGSLVFSLPIEYEARMVEYEKDGVERKYPYCDYEYIPKSEWSYAYSSRFVTLEKCEISDVPFSSKKPPVVVKAKVKNIAFPAVYKIFNCKYMSFRKVSNVDIVSYASSVLCGIVCTVNAYFFSLAVWHLQYKRNKMTFRIMCFANFA